MPKKKQDRPRRHRWTPEEASIVLAKQTASGLSVQQFAAREGLDAERLYRWRRRLETAPDRAQRSLRCNRAGGRESRSCWPRDMSCSCRIR